LVVGEGFFENVLGGHAAIMSQIATVLQKTT